jgi:glycosyltransferase involved in cell wall biosynthesis
MTAPVPALADLPAPSFTRERWPWTDAAPPLPPARRDGSAWPRITIVTPSYEQGEFLEETIRSVLLQGYPNLEYFVIDGGSRDQSPDIVRNYERWLAGWVSEPDGGQANAVNKGWRQSSGDILGWLNSDDILLPGALRTIAEAFSDPHVMVTTGFRKFYDERSRFLQDGVEWRTTDDTLRYECTVAQETTYWRREILDRLGALDETYRYALDYEYWQRMLSAGYHFTVLPAYLGGFRLHDRSKGATMNDVRERELRRIHHHYQMVQSEDELRQRLNTIRGKHWWRTQRILLWLQRRPRTNSPRTIMRAHQLLNTPILSTMLIYTAVMATRVRNAWRLGG